MSSYGEDQEDRQKKGRREGDFLLGLAWREKIKRPGKKPLVQVHFYWKRIFVLFSILAVVGWLLGGGALYFYFKERRNYEEVSYFKMLILPLRLDSHSKEMGEYFIERGIEEIEEGNFRSGFHYLRTGLARSPDHPEARILLARIFHSPGFGDNRLAIQALSDGLKYSDQDPAFLEVEYLSLLFMLLSLEERDEERIDLADELMSQVDDPAVRALLILQSAKAEGELGRFRDAINRLKESGIVSSPPGTLLLGDILWSAGQERQSLATFERGLENYPTDARLIDAFYSLLIEEERWEELLSHTNYRRLVQPDNHKVWTARLAALQGLGHEDQVIPAVYTLLDKFTAEEIGFEILRFSVENQRVDVAEIAYARLEESGALANPHVALMGLAYLRGDQPERLLEFFDEIEDEELVVEESRAAIMRAMAFMMMGDNEAAIPYFQEFLDSDQIQASAYTTLGRFYSEAGLDDPAYEILERGLERFPSDRDILFQIMEFDLEQSGRHSYVEHAGALVNGRVPDLKVLADVRTELLSDRCLFVPGREDLVDSIDSVFAQSEALTTGTAITTSVERGIEIDSDKPDREFMKLQ